MFADASVPAEIHRSACCSPAMLTRAMHRRAGRELSDEDVAIARVIGDVWFSALMAGSPAAPAPRGHRPMDVAVRLLLR